MVSGARNEILWGTGKVSNFLGFGQIQISVFVRWLGAEGGGTWWLVTEPILTEGGELHSVVTSEDGKMRDFGQMGPD